MLTSSLNNIKFLGSLPRPTLNNLLNQSKLGLVTSNQNDGCPRIITEILCAGIPLMLRDTTRALYYYTRGTFRFADKDIEVWVKSALGSYKEVKKETRINLKRLSMANICRQNLAQWGLI